MKSTRVPLLLFMLGICTADNLTNSVGLGSSGGTVATSYDNTDKRSAIASDLIGQPGTRSVRLQRRASLPGY
jgi:hypothetical protein